MSILNLIRTLTVAGQSGVLVALPGVIIAFIILYYLLTPPVMAFFKHGEQSSGPKPQSSLA